MKMFAAAVLTGLLGALAGSLAAQPPGADRNGPPSRGVIYEGSIILVLTGELGRKELQGNGRVYDGWVVLDDQGTMIPREQIQRIMIGEAGRRDEFGNRPDGESPERDDPLETPDRPTRPFRQD